MKLPAGIVLVVLLLALVASFAFWVGARAPRPAPAPLEEEPAEASSEQVHQFCGACHAYPPPSSFPRSAWRHEVQRGYDFFRTSELRTDSPSLENVVRYYEARAPLELPPLDRGPAPKGPPRMRFDRLGMTPAQSRGAPGVTNVHLAHLSDPRKLDLIVCHCNPGLVLSLKAYESPPAWQLLGQLEAPAHAEVVDLDGDGHQDLLVADLGIFFPSNERVGRVVWLRGDGAGGFTPVPLLEGVGRVADVRTADFNGDGKLDLVVAVFGWNTLGEVLYLENHTTDWSRPNFTRRQLDGRHGAIHVPVGDVNGDGRPDIVALISQATEAVVAFLGRGDGTFEKQTLFEAPHPAYGSSGIQLVDMNGDGKLDVLYTNGDILDPPFLLKPYHGIQWLENRGTYPFVHHPLTAMYGVMRALAADVDGDGDLDVLAVSFLPPEEYPQLKEIGAESVLLLEQTAPGRFERRVLESASCNHLTCAVGDLFGDGRTHLVAGNFFLTPTLARGDTLTIWKQPAPPEKPVARPGKK
jgi:hypothetical protein